MKKNLFNWKISSVELERPVSRTHFWNKILKRKKPSTWWDFLNPWHLRHETCAQQLCYNHSRLRPWWTGSESHLFHFLFRNLISILPSLLSFQCRGGQTSDPGALPELRPSRRRPRQDQVLLLRSSKTPPLKKFKKKQLQQTKSIITRDCSLVRGHLQDWLLVTVGFAS